MPAPVVCIEPNKGAPAGPDQAQLWTPPFSTHERGCPGYEGVHQIAYVSLRAPGLADSAARDIVVASRRNNAVQGVTGALIHDGQHFAQVLEGRPALVKATFRRILLDPRHARVELLHEGWAKQRDFGTWVMAYVHDHPSIPDFSDGRLTPANRLAKALAAPHRAAAVLEVLRSATGWIG